jgi:hypothetical protein
MTMTRQIEHYVKVEVLDLETRKCVIDFYFQPAGPPETTT